MPCDFAKEHFGKFRDDLKLIRELLDYIEPHLMGKPAGWAYFKRGDAALKRIEEASDGRD